MDPCPVCSLSAFTNKVGVSSMRSFNVIHELWLTFHDHWSITMTTSSYLHHVANMVTIRGFMPIRTVSSIQHGHVKHIATLCNPWWHQWHLNDPCWHRSQSSINNRPSCHWWQHSFNNLCSPYHHASLFSPFGINGKGYPFVVLLSFSIFTPSFIKIFAFC